MLLVEAYEYKNPEAALLVLQVSYVVEVIRFLDVRVVVRIHDQKNDSNDVVHARDIPDFLVKVGVGVQYIGEVGFTLARLEKLHVRKGARDVLLDANVHGGFLVDQVLK